MLLKKVFSSCYHLRGDANNDIRNETVVARVLYGFYLPYETDMHIHILLSLFMVHFLEHLRRRDSGAAKNSLNRLIISKHGLHYCSTENSLLIDRVRPFPLLLHRCQHGSCRRYTNTRFPTKSKQEEPPPCVSCVLYSHFPTTKTSIHRASIGLRSETKSTRVFCTVTHSSTT